MTKKKWYDKYRRRSKKKKKSVVKVKDHSHKKRKYLVDASKCIHLNEKFNGSSQHHINRNIIINIPEELHRHIIHNMRTGFGMSVINLLSYQFLFGGLDGNFLDKSEIESF